MYFLILFLTLEFDMSVLVLGKLPIDSVYCIVLTNELLIKMQHVTYSHYSALFYLIMQS